MQLMSMLLQDREDSETDGFFRHCLLNIDPAMELRNITYWTKNKAHYLGADLL